MTSTAPPAVATHAEALVVEKLNTSAQTGNTPNPMTTIPSRKIFMMDPFLMFAAICDALKRPLIRLLANVERIRKRSVTSALQALCRRLLRLRERVAGDCVPCAYLDS